MSRLITGNARRDYDRLTAAYLKIKDERDDLEELRKSNVKTIKGLQKRIEDLTEELNILHAKIKALENELAHAKAIQDHDSTNTSSPTSQTKPGKKKHIPNSRRSTGKSKGGQTGHPKHSLKPIAPGEETETVIHGGPNDGQLCPKCNSGNYEYTGHSVEKSEYDIKITVRKVKHVWHIYRCLDCGTLFRDTIDPRLKDPAQYGMEVEAFLLSLVNIGNVPMNKAGMVLNGLTGGELNPSDGYIAKLQKRNANRLDGFDSELRRHILQMKILCWDDTVIMVDTKRACLRFYGDTRLALYTAHEHKDLDSLMEDKILPLLTSETTVMHDHNTVNYNEAFHFKNIECNQHLQRDLQRVTDDTGHTWANELKELISATIKARKDAIAAGHSSFSPEFIQTFEDKVSAIIKKGWKELGTVEITPNTDPFERALLNRFKKYLKNYFQWVKDFSLPTTSNTAERALRRAKSKSKVSGQFESIQSAKYYARINSYIETCRRNGINDYEALRRLVLGKPYTLAEILSHSSG